MGHFSSQNVLIFTQNMRFSGLASEYGGARNLSAALRVRCIEEPQKRLHYILCGVRFRGRAVPCRGDTIKEETL